MLVSSAFCSVPENQLSSRSLQDLVPSPTHPFLAQTAPPYCVAEIAPLDCRSLAAFLELGARQVTWKKLVLGWGVLGLPFWRHFKVSLFPEGSDMYSFHLALVGDFSHVT